MGQKYNFFRKNTNQKILQNRKNTNQKMGSSHSRNVLYLCARFENENSV